MITNKLTNNDISSLTNLTADPAIYTTSQSISATSYGESITQSCECCEHKSTCKYYDKLKSIIGLSNIDMSEILDADVVDAVTIYIRCKYFKDCHSTYVINTPIYQPAYQLTKKDWNEYKITCSSACIND